MKKLAWGLGIFVGLLFLLGVGLEYVLDLNAYKGTLLDALQKIIHRQIAIGNISHTLLRGPGATIHDVTVFEPDRTTAFLKIDNILAQVKLWPLLTRKVEVASIRVNAPLLVLKRDLTGGWNFQDLLGTPTAAAPPDSPASESSAAKSVPAAAKPAVAVPADATPQTVATSASATAVSIDSLRVLDGTVRIVDEQTNVTTEFNHLDTRLTDFALNAPLRFELAADVNGGSDGKIEAAGTIGSALNPFDMDVVAKLADVNVRHFTQYYMAAANLPAADEGQKLNATLQVAGNPQQQLTSSGEVRMGEVNVKVAGHVAQATTTPQLDLTITSEKLPWPKLLQLFPPELAKSLKDLDLSGLGTLTLQPKGTFDRLGITGTFDLSQSGLGYQKIFVKPVALKSALTFDLLLTPDALEIAAGALTFDQTELTVSGSVSNFQQPTLDLRVTSNSFPLAQLLALFPDLQALLTEQNVKRQLRADGTAALELTVKGAADDLAIDLQLALAESAIAYRNMLAKPVKVPGEIIARARFKENTLTLEDSRVTLGDLTLTATGTIADLTKPRFDLHVATNTFPFHDLFAYAPIVRQEYLPPELTLAGLGALQVTIKGTPENLTLTGRIDVNQGQLAFGQYFQKPADIPGVIDFDLNLTPEVLKFKKIRLNINDVILDLTGTLSSLQKAPRLQLAVASNRFALNQLLPFTGMDMQPDGTTQLSFTLNGLTDRFDERALVAAQVELAEVALTLPQLAEPVSHLNARLELQDQVLTVQDLSATLGESALRGHATIAQPLTAPQMNFTLHAPNLNIDALLKPPAAAHLGEVVSLPRAPGAAGLQFIANPPSNATARAGLLDQLTATGDLTIERGQAHNLHFTNVVTTLQYEQQQLTAQPLDFDLYDGHYHGDLRLDLSSAEPAYALAATLTDVDTNQMLTDGFAAPDLVRGKLSAQAAFAGQSFSAAALTNAITGKAELSIQDGSLSSFNLWPQLAEIFTLIGNLSQSAEFLRMAEDLRQFPAETRFSRCNGSFEIVPGQPGVSNLVIEVPEQNMFLTMLLDGQFDADRSLDVLGKLRFLPQSKYYADLKKIFRDFKQADESIELPLPIPVGGTLLKPEINMPALQRSLIALAKEIGKQQLQDKGQDLLEDMGKKLLQDLL